MKYAVESQKSLLKYWINILVSDSFIEGIFQKCEIEFPPELLPKTLHVSRISSKLSRTFLNRSRSAHVTDEQRKIGTQFVTAVAKQAGLTIDVQGGIQLLMDSTSCTRSFTKSVLQAISEGTEEQLLTLNVCL